MHPMPQSSKSSLRRRLNTPISTLAACLLFAGGLGAMSIQPDPADADPMDTHPAHDGVTSPEGAADEGLNECVITLVSGRKITGFLIESRDEEVVIRLEGIDTTFKRSGIGSIRFLPPVAERYLTLRENINDTDIETRLTLVEWLRAREAYQLAVEELASILEVEPNNPQARTLHNWLKAKLAMDEQKKATKKTKARRSPKADPTSIPTLSDEQINLMRVYEIDLRNPPKLVVPDNTLRELIARHPEEFPVDESARAEYFELPEVEKLKLLFIHHARDLYGQVRVIEDPAMLKEFTTMINGRRGWLVNACASTSCHGGTEAGSFRLVRERPNSHESAYTNFYRIDQYRLKDGSPLIDYESPARSALLQLAMHQSNSLRPHPEVITDRRLSRWRPVFRSSRDRKFKLALDWISSVYAPRVQYDLGYPPPPASAQPDLDADQDDETSPQSD